MDHTRTMDVVVDVLFNCRTYAREWCEGDARRDRLKKNLREKRLNRGGQSHGRFVSSSLLAITRLPDQSSLRMACGCA